MQLLHFFLESSQTHCVRDNYLHASIGGHVHGHPQTIEVKGEVHSIDGWLNGYARRLLENRRARLTIFKRALWQDFCYPQETESLVPELNASLPVGPLQTNRTHKLPGDKLLDDLFDLIPVVAERPQQSFSKVVGS